MVDPVLVERATSLSIDERLELIGAIWDSIDHERRGVSPAVETLLRERLAEADADPLVGRSWDDIKRDWHARNR